jgi:hypothetical protein
VIKNNEKLTELDLSGKKKGKRPNPDDDLFTS